jgi:NAD(P)H-hydrate epimerase
MRVATIAEVQEIEQRVIEKGMPAERLMELAAHGMRDVLLADPLTRNSQEALILAGKGNNGGDGIVLARLLMEEGWNVRIVLAAEPLGDIPHKKLDQLKRLFPDVDIVSDAEKVKWPGDRGILIDALLGTGSKEKPHGLLGEWIRRANEWRWTNSFRTVALDLPSGLYEGTEEVHDAVISDLTIAVGFPKKVLVEERFSNWVGRLEVVPLFDSETESISDERELLSARDLRPLLPRRLPQSYKGTYGKVLILAGSLGMTGAAALTSSASLRVGAGLTYLSTFTDCIPHLAGVVPPEVMIRDLFSGELFDLFQVSNAIAVGPGLGQTQESLSALSYLLDHAHKPIVIDASALTLLATHPELEAMIPEGSILTPHFGEMERLLKGDLVDRELQVLEYAQKRKVVVVLKGTRTIVVSPEGKIHYNSTGNPGLAKGGSGDVLTGILVGLMAQGLDSWSAARLGVWLHGKAADEALAKMGAEESVVASDVVDSIAEAIVELRRL